MPETLNADTYFNEFEGYAGRVMEEQFYDARYVMEGDRIGFSNFADEDGWILSYTFRSTLTGSRRNSRFVPAEEFRATYAEFPVDKTFAKPLPEGTQIRHISVGARYEARDPLSGLTVERNADEPGFVVTRPGDEPEFYYNLDFHVLFRDHGMNENVDPPTRVRIAQGDPDAKLHDYVILDRDAEVDTIFNGVMPAKAGDVLVRFRPGCYIVQSPEMFVTSYQVMRPFEDCRPEREAQQRALQRVRARGFKKLGM